jgi:hypothetical protein
MITDELDDIPPAFDLQGIGFNTRRDENTPRSTAIIKSADRPDVKVSTVIVILILF